MGWEVEIGVRGKCQGNRKTGMDELLISLEIKIRFIVER